MFRSLASSSRGNAYLVSDSDTTLLLECGVTYQTLERKTGFQLSRVNACFITHEHQDHCKAAAQLLRRGFPVYASEGTAEALQLPDIELIQIGVPVVIGALRIMAFPVMHDAAQPVGYLIDDTRTKERLFFSADTRGLNYIISHPTYIAVECNYEESVLAAKTKIPDRLKDRIRHTHFEVHDVIRWLKKQDLTGVLTIWLLHLSAGNSREAAWNALFHREFPGIDIRICPE